MFHSKSTGWFYLPGSNMPEDAVEVTQEEHVALLAEQAVGRALADRPPPTEAEIVAELTRAVQDHLDAGAQAAGYDDIKSAVTYADEPAVPRFQLEGQAFRAWRSLCWSACYAIMAEVKSGARSIPTATELISELPALELPA